MRSAGPLQNRVTHRAVRAKWSPRFLLRCSVQPAAAPANQDSRNQLRPKNTTTKITVFSAARYVKDFLSGPLKSSFENISFLDVRLSPDTAQLAKGSNVVCLFVNDDCDAQVVEELAAGGVQLIAMRCAGYDRIDLDACSKNGIKVVRVPSYSPNAVAEHAVGIIMCLSRSLHKCFNRTREGNFTLNGLERGDIHGKTVGIIGTGKIGLITARIMKGFDTELLMYDMYPNQQEADRLGGTYVSLEELFRRSDIISIHAPLNPSTHHMISTEQIALMKRGVIIINVSRGGLIDTPALLRGIKEGKVGAVGLDVYENEGPLFFKDLSAVRGEQRMKYWDTTMSELMALPNVLVTPHSAFLTDQALSNIASTTVDNILSFVDGAELSNEVKPSSPSPT